MKRLLLAPLFVITAYISVGAQTENEGQNPPLTQRQAAAQVELYRARQAFDSNKYSVARRHAERAAALDPEEKDSLIIIARSLRALYRANDDGNANLVRAREAIAAYLRVPIGPEDTEVYETVKDLYGATGEDDLQYSWVLMRAINYALPIAKRVEAYLDLALFDLKSSTKISEAVADIIYDNKSDTLDLERVDIAAGNELTRGHEIASRGLQAAERAIILDPENETAPVREVLLLMNIARLFELEGNDAQADQNKTKAREVAAQAAVEKAKREEAVRARMVTVECDALCDRVVNTPKPPYPAIARTARAFGAVVVHIEIDDEGKVISATAFSGHPLLRAAAVQAAQRSTFSRRQASERPKNVYGSLIYNFTLE